MIASLPMYDRASTRAANARLWQGMRAALGYGPVSLSDPDDLWEMWRSPELLFSQTCSLPFAMTLHRSVEVIASPVHGLDCPAGHYFSYLVARTGSAPVGRVAVNGLDSQSGFGAMPAALVAEPPLVTGSHAASVKAISSGEADVAAIDAVTWGLLDREGATAGLQVVDAMPPTPALPFVTARGNDVAALRSALSKAVDTLSDADKDALNLYGVTQIDAAAYLALPIPAGTCQTS